MILCVTLNPCLDKTLTVPPWSPSDNVRGVALSEVVGGKGNNVARALLRLGRWARPVTFLGGPAGVHCGRLLRETDGFDPIIAPSQATTRTILTVRTEGANNQTAFFDPDPAISPAEADDLLKRVERVLADGVEALTLSGSSPSEATHGLYVELISLAKVRKVPVYLDTYGPPLDSVWGFWPHALQLNRREAGQHLNLRQPSDGDILDLLQRWARHGVRLSLVTNGPAPVLAQVDGRLFKIQPPEIKAVNPVGSGDCLLAGLVDAELSGADPETILRHGVASAAANAMVWDAGALDRATVERLEAGIVVGPIQPGGRDDGKKGSGFVRVGVYGRPLTRYGRPG